MLGSRDLLRAAVLAIALAAGVSPAGAASSLRFFGNGVGDIDRVKVRIDPPDLVTPGPPADVGATDFTIEFWIRGLAAENAAPPASCGQNIDWIYGNIVVDRDRYNQARKFGLSIAGGVPVWGVTGEDGASTTICGVTQVLDGVWHHVAAQRRRSDGWLALFVDGTFEAQADGPDGDVSYPDDGIPGDYCGGPCTNSDPYLVLAAEKHDAGPAYPSFSGWLDELRLSSTLRYAASFTRPSSPFATDAATAALYHFDEGAGDVAGDVSGAPGGPSDGVLRTGGTPAGPQWSVDVFESLTASVAPGPAAGARSIAAPNPFTTGTSIFVPRTVETLGALAIVDAQGREIARIHGWAEAGGTRYDWNGLDRGGKPARPGVYFARGTSERRAFVVRLVRR